MRAHKVDNAVKATCEKVKRNYADFITVQSKHASNAQTREQTKATSDMDLNVRKSVRNQGIPDGPEKSKAEKLAPRLTW